MSIIRYLQIGDKVIYKQNDEAGEIIEIIDANNAKIEFFDETLLLNSESLNPYSLTKNYINSVILFQSKEKPILKSENEVFETPVFIDLHIENLIRNSNNLNRDEILRKQLNALETYLFRAIDARLFSVTIIHGKGAGILRTEVLKMVKNKFGLNTSSTADPGKTEVRIK